MQSPGFSKFRHLMDIWDSQLALEDERVRIGNHVDGHGLILFFKHGDDIFGAPEESRLVFAKMKTKEDEEDGDAWRHEAKFTALNLIQSLLGQQTQGMFGLKDLKKLHLMDREDALAELMKKKDKPQKKGKKDE